MADQVQGWLTELAESDTPDAVWNKVRYLDSPSDYREYLSEPTKVVHLLKSEFVVLDTGRFPWSKATLITVIAFLIGTTFLWWLRG